MGRLLSLVLVAAMLALAVMWMPSGNPERQLVEVTQIATRPSDGRVAGAPAGGAVGGGAGTRTFSPQKPLFSAREIAAASRPVQGSPSGQPDRAALGLASSPLIDGAQAAGVKAPGLSSNSDVASGSTSSGTLALVRKIQDGLKTAGCYWGDIDGDWGPGSRRAMRQYMKAVNASLPTDEPDEILLKLVQRNAIEDCLPPAIIAHRRNRPTQVAVTEVREPAPVRAAAGDTNIRQRRASTYIADATRPAAPLPGRMSIGAPVSEPLLDRAPRLVRQGDSSDSDSRQVRVLRSANVGRRLPITRPRAVRNGGGVIVYTSARVPVVRQRGYTRRPARGKRNVYDTAWARAAFKTE